MLLTSWLAARPSRLRRRPRPAAPAATERLEDRTLLSGLTLSVAIDRTSVSEGAGAAAATGTVTRNGADLSQPLVVTLTSSDASSVTVPNSVTIAAGAASASFAVAAVDDAVLDGDRPVTISASSAYSSGTVGLDPSFGSAGIAPTSLRMNLQWPYAAVAVQADGKIVAASEDAHAGSWRLTRLNPDGSLDATFGQSGVAVTRFGDTNRPVPRRIVIQSDGKILVGGKISSGVGASALARYNADGTSDTSFGSAGIANVSGTGTGTWIEDLEVRSDGKIMLAVCLSGTSYFRVARLNADGTFDASFGTGGVRTYNSINDRTNTIELLADGSFVLAGGHSVARFDGAGAPDVSFGVGGVMHLPYGTGEFPEIRRSQVLPDGRIVLGGTVYDEATGEYDFMAARLTAAGGLDSTFSGDGFLQTDFTGRSDYATSMHVQADGKVVLSGFIETSAGVRDAALARYNADGTPDATFDGDGLFSHSLIASYPPEMIFDVAPQQDGKLVALGGWHTDFRVARYDLGVAVATSNASLTVVDDEIATAVVDTLADEDDGNYGTADLSLREAIKIVMSGGTVTFASALAGGTITLGAQLLLTKNVTIAGLGASRLVVSGNNASRIFQVLDGVTAELRSLTLTKGNAGGAGSVGGAILNSGNLTIADSVISASVADYGGGVISGNGSILTVDSTEISGNTARATGGGINVSGAVVITRSTIAGNTASSFGGGVFNFGVLSIADSTISGNTTGESGGGILNGDGTLTVSNVTVSGNTAAQYGGGVRQSNGTVLLRNATVYGNRADSNGSGGETGGGVSAITAGSVTMHNTLVAGNTRGFGAGTANDVGGTLAAASSFNLIGNAASAGGLTHGTNGNVLGVSAASVLDPVLRDNGGPTKTHALRVGSAAINAGSNAQALAPGGSALTSDQRGLARVLGASVDIGAYEALASAVVDILADEDDGNYSTGDLSLREAIKVVASGGTVNFAAALAGKTITLGGTRLDVAGALTINGPGITISGNNTSQVFAVAAGGSLSLAGLTLTNGRASNASFDTWEGGAIFNEGTLTLTNVVLRDSTADFRGSILHNEGTVTMTGGAIRGGSVREAVVNYAGTFSATGVTFTQNSGGVFFNWATLAVADSVFQANQGTPIYNFGSGANTTVARSSFIGNTGGAVGNHGATFRISDSVFTGNTASSAGAIDNFSGEMEITGSVIYGNVATTFHGGAIENSGTLRVSNTTISGNEAGWYGGALYAWSGSATFRNVTITGNRVNLDGNGFEDGAGIYQSGQAVVTLYNTIVAGNTLGGAGVAEDIHGSVTGTHNIIGSAGAAGGLTSTNGNIVGVSAAAVLDPVLKNNGGPTLTHALVAGSIAINAGSNGQALNASSPGSALTTDQRGVGFPRIVNGRVDIGAVEAPKPTSVVVDILADEDDGNYGAGDLSLREAVFVVATGGTITFAGSLAGGTITLGGSAIVLTRDVTIAGLGASQLAVSGGGVSGVFYIDTPASVEIRGLTITEGRAGSGAGINSWGSLVLVDSAVVNNTAVNFGGGISADLGLTIRNSTFSGNVAGISGGAIITTGVLHVSNSTFSDNVAAKVGGAICNSGGQATIVNSTVFRNRADSLASGESAGGGVYSSSSAPTVLFNTIVAGNTEANGITPNDVGGHPPSTASSNNLIGDTLTAGYIKGGVNGNVVGVDWTTVLDPVLKDNGGPTKTHALLVGSIAVNSGSNAAATAPDGTPLIFDQRGAGFPRVVGSAVDIGAFEARNSAPAANPDAVSANEDSPLSGSLFGDNGFGADADPDRDALRITAVNGVALGGSSSRTVTFPSGATLTVNADGTFAFDPSGVYESLAAGQTARVTFTYTVEDGFGGTATATVAVTIQGVNDAPTAAPRASRTNEHGTTSGGVLGGAADAEGDSLSVSKVNGVSANVGQTVTLASGARLRVNGDGTYLYDPAGAFVRLRRGQFATDSFSYTISDGNGGLTTVTETVTVEGGGNEADLIANLAGEWYVGASNGSSFATGLGAKWANAAWTALKTGDFDGDGRTDVLGLLQGEWYVGLARTAASGLTTFATALWGKWGAVGWENVLVGDVDGDGRDDIVAEALGQWYGARSTGAAFTAPAWLTRTADVGWDLSTLADVTGDGKADLVVVLGGEWYVAASASTASVSAFGGAARWAGTGAGPYQLLTLADMNNDGKADAVGFAGGEWRVGTSNGASAFAVSLRAKWANVTWLDPVVGDFDGDGRADLAARFGGHWYVGLSNAAGGEKSRSLWASWNNLAWKDVRAGDFDGDGRTDLAARFNGEWYVARATDGGSATALWARWREAAWNAVAGSDADGVVPPLSSPPPTPAGFRLAPSLAAPAPSRDEPLTFFWSQAEKDEDLAAALLGGR